MPKFALLNPVIEFSKSPVTNCKLAGPFGKLLRKATRAAALVALLGEQGDGPGRLADHDQVDLSVPTIRPPWSKFAGTAPSEYIQIIQKSSYICA